MNVVQPNLLYHLIPSAIWIFLRFENSALDFGFGDFIWVLLEASLWRCGNLVVSSSDFQPEGRWLKSGLCGCVVSLDEKLCSTLSLLTQVYKWVPAT